LNDANPRLPIGGYSAVGVTDNTHFNANKIFIDSSLRPPLAVRNSQLVLPVFMMEPNSVGISAVLPVVFYRRLQIRMSRHRAHYVKTWHQNHTTQLQQFLCVLCCQWSSSNGVTIRYVFPVLWMTSCIHTIGPMGRNQARCYV